MTGGFTAVARPNAPVRSTRTSAWASRAGLSSQKSATPGASFAKACLDAGFRVQKSVFECSLPPERFERVWNRLLTLIDSNEDALAAYPLCHACQSAIRSAGIPRTLTPQQALYLF